MSLLYIIDGYNITSHTKFSPLPKKINDPRRVLLEFIKTHKLCGSPKNKIAVVFDGYPNLPSQKLDKEEINVIFSKEETADNRIKKMLETQGNPKNTVVVSDDKEIRFFVKAVGARSIGVEEFIHPQVKPQRKKEDLIKPELNYSQIDQINKELKTRWLKD